MPIVALEGPDRSGKSTVFELLRTRISARFLPGLPTSKALLNHIQLVEQRTEILWTTLYHPETLYICDRFYAVSGEVYDALYSRPKRIYTHPNDLVVFYFDVPQQELVRRHLEAGDALFDLSEYTKTLSLYSEVLSKFRTIRLDATRPSHIIAEEIENHLRNTLRFI